LTLNILVLGGSGFIGSNLRSINSDKHKFFFIGRNDSDNYNINEFSRTKFHNEIEAFKPNVVLDLATCFNLYPKFEDFETLVDGTLTFHIKMFRELERYNLPWVYTSSYWQSLRNPNLRAISDYHYLKKIVEGFLFQESARPVLSIAMMDTFGTGDKRAKIVKMLMEISPDSAPLELSEGNQLLNLLHVRDAVSGLILGCELVQNSNQNESFHLISKEFITLRELAEKVELIRGIRLPIIWGARPYRPGELFEAPINITRIPGWKESLTMSEGLSLMTS